MTATDKLKALIIGHGEAMIEQLNNPNVKLEHLVCGEWIPTPSHSPPLSDGTGPNCKKWTRLAPAPRMVDLDQSDFLGDGRVTHVRAGGCDDIVFAMTAVYRDHVIAGSVAKTYRTLKESYECSRDNGATFGPCSRPEKESK